MRYKRRSLDGFFNNSLKIENFEKKRNKFSKFQTILGEGNSISKLPYVKNIKAIKLISKNFFKIDKKKKF